MVATSIHYIFGILIAYLFGYKSSKKYKLGLIAMLPDLDTILMAILMLIKNIFDLKLSFLETNPIAVIFLSHRGFSHSIFLLIILIVTLYFLKKDKQFIKIFSLIWASHLFLDLITAWKLFPLLPFSYYSISLGIIEIFDPILVLLSTLLFSFFIYNDLQKKGEKKWIYISSSILLFFGFFLSFFMKEYNYNLFIISLLILVFTFILNGLSRLAKLSTFYKNKKRINKNTILFLSYTIYSYIVILFIFQIYFSSIYNASITSIEPIEDFKFNYNEHSLEIDKGNYYLISNFNLFKIYEEKKINKFINNDLVNDTSIYVSAYKKSIHYNWINYPVYTFKKENDTVYVNIKYAKSFLKTKDMPGPRNGINLILSGNNEYLIRYGKGFFD